AKRAPRVIARPCGGIQATWAGKCPACGAWDSLEEVRTSGGSSKDAQRGIALAATALGEAPKAERIGDVRAETAALQRMSTGIGEFDRVLGGRLTGEQGKVADPGGIVPGSAVLVGGDPGIGKSTLLLQAAHELAKSGTRVLYVTSEESVQQLRLRAHRLSNFSDEPDELYV